MIYTTIFQTYTTEIENYIEAELSQVKSLNKKLLFTQQQEQQEQQQRSNLFNLKLIRLNNQLQYLLFKLLHKTTQELPHPHRSLSPIGPQSMSVITLLVNKVKYTDTDNISKLLFPATI